MRFLFEFGYTSTVTRHPGELFSDLSMCLTLVKKGCQTLCFPYDLRGLEVSECEWGTSGCARTPSGCPVNVWTQVGVNWPSICI